MVTSFFLLAAFNLLGARVEVPHNAEPSTVLSVTELTNYVAKISGMILEVEVEGREGGGNSTVNLNLQPQPSIFIGTLKTLKDVPERARTALANAKQYEAAWMGTEGGNLWIVGKEETADLYATYHFLETKLGVRWFQAAVPEDPGDYVPKADSIVIDDFAEFREPDFEVRRLDMCSGYWYVVPKAGKTCAVRNGYQTPTHLKFFERDPKHPDFHEFYGPRQSRRNWGIGGGHEMFTAPTLGMKFEEHPEYFALVNGERRKGLQFCFSSEGLLRRTADYAIARFKENRGLGDYLFGQADVTYGWCECEKCRAMDPPGTDYETAGPNISTRLYKMSERLAKMIRAEVPDADLRLWAYNTYRQLPVGITPDPDLKVQFCDHGRCYGHHLDDPNCVRNVEMLSLMRKWLSYWPKLYTYEYFVCTPPLYVCHEHDEAHDLRLYKSLGMIGWKNEGEFTGTKFVPGVGQATADIFPSNWQWLYVTGHLLWDVNRDVDELLADAESKYYGRAAGPMLKYHALRRRLWAENRACMGYPMDDPKRPTLLSAKGAKNELLGYLDEADRLTKGDKVLEFRVGRDRKWLNDYWVKPNEKMVEEEKRAITARRAKGPIVIDGVGGEEDWKSAAVADDFRKTVARPDGTYPELDPRLHTEVRVLRDDASFYLLFTALEPHPEKMTLKSGHDHDNWAGDGLELMFAPPAVDCRYYQIATTANGDGVYDASHPGGNVGDDYGVEAKGRILADRYVVEMRIPVKKMHPLRPGELWRILFARNRTFYDEIYSHHWEHNFSVGGSGYHDKVSFTPVRIGE